MPEKCSIKQNSDGPIAVTKIVISDNRPHWRRYGGGHAFVEFMTHREAKWLSIDSTEHSAETKSSKRTMITLDEKSARALYDQLATLFAGVK